MTTENSKKSKITVFMWHIGRILTDMMIISDTTGSPIISQTFQAGSKLFDVLGNCVYNNQSFKKIFLALNDLITSLDYDFDDNFNDTIKYAQDFCQDFIVFLEENKLKN
ncbi:MAG: hypothetical protein JW891_14485 [Candidatus Lokiarchaeota archaeon]|nr:hypothetical protein [Candidatus Lokiarchaeota archaeon]